MSITRILQSCLAVFTSPLNCKFEKWVIFENCMGYPNLLHSNTHQMLHKPEKFINFVLKVVHTY